MRALYTEFHCAKCRGVATTFSQVALSSTRQLTKSQKDYAKLKVVNVADNCPQMPCEYNPWVHIHITFLRKCVLNILCVDLE